jgi:hypothetical protein
MLPALLFPALLAACHDGPNDKTPTKITAVALHTAFMRDAKSAEKRWRGKTLLITGVVANAAPRMTGWTMTKAVEVPAKVYLKTEVDYLPHDIKYVVCEPDFDIPQPSGGFILDPRIVVGKELTVECSPAKFNWSEPGLYLSNCRIAGPSGYSFGVPPRKGY